MFACVYAYTPQACSRAARFHLRYQRACTIVSMLAPEGCVALIGVTAG